MNYYSAKVSTLSIESVTQYLVYVTSFTHFGGTGYWGIGYWEI
jgi:hypothetical protein